MIKKLGLIIVMFLLCGSKNGFCSVRDAIYHSVPVTAALEFKAQVVAVGKAGITVVRDVKTLQTDVQITKSNLQTAVTSTFNNIVSGAVLNVGDLGKPSGATFMGKKLTKVKTEKIVNKIKRTLMTYDSLHKEDKDFVDKSREAFYLDNLYAVAAAAQGLEKNLEDVKNKVIEAQECAKGDGAICGIPSSDDGGKNEVWFTYGETLAQYDRLVKIWETVAALRARLEAVQSLRLIEPKVAQDSEKKEDNESDSNVEQKTSFEDTAPMIFKNHTTIPLGFAQLTYQKSLKSISSLKNEISEKTTKNFMPTVNFVAPDEPDTEHPMVANEAKLEALNEMRDVQEIVDKAAEAHNMISEIKTAKETAEQYHEEEKKYQKVLKKLEGAEQCALNYMRLYFKDPIKAWSGVDLRKNANRHDLRKGISGWAVDAFEVAKAAETNTIKTDDIEEYSMEEGMEDKYGDDPTASTADGEINKIEANMSQSKIEESQKETRKATMTAWQIGAEASKILGEDPKKWGTPTDRKMIWNDTKHFYQQYLRRKYNNVKAYLQRYTKEDVLAIVIAKLKNEEKDITETTYQKKLLEADADSDKDQQDSIKKMKVSMQEYDTGVVSKLEELMKKRKTIVVKIDKTQASIKQGTKDVADLKNTAEEQAQNQIEEAMETQDEEKITPISSNEQIGQSLQSANKLTLNKEKLESMQKQVKKDRTEQTKQEENLKEIDSTIASVKLNAQGQRAGQNNIASTLAAIRENLGLLKKKNTEEYSAAINANLASLFPPTAAAGGLKSTALIAEAENAVNRINAEVEAIIEAGYEQMIALGDDLYSGKAHDKVVEIHNNMINQIKAIKLIYSVAGVINIDDILVYAKLLTADLEPEDEGFFVGAMPKERDMRAPFKMLNFDLPPVREVFYFDENDFNAVKPYNQNSTGRNITASEFLNFGGDIPAIWKYMLRDDAFIESSYDLAEGLSIGCEDTAFSRGGIMPCVIDGSKIVVDVNKKGEYIKRTDLKTEDLPRCYHISMKGGKPHHVAFDGDVIFAQPAVFFFNKVEEEKPLPRTCIYSELGMLFEADENNNLSFRERAYNAYTLLQNDKANNGEPSAQEKNALAAATHAILNQNQMGDFLHHVELEQNLKKNLDEIKKNYDEQMDALKEKLQSIGFEVSDDFDISQEKDFNNVMKKINTIRSEQLTSAQNSIKDIEVKDNAPAEETKKSLMQMVTLMKKDEKGVVRADSVSSESSDIDEQIKRATADGAVVDKLKNSLKDQEKEYTDVDEVFCANYE